MKTGCCVKEMGVLSAVCSLAMFAATAQANLLDDGSFELATNDSQTSNSNWTMTADVPDGSNASARFSTSVWAASDGDTGVWFQSFEGNQDPGDPTANADVTQTVSNVAAGGTYQLLFDSARETFFTAGQAFVTLSASSGPSVTIDLLTATYNDDGNMNSNPTQFSLLLPGVQAGDDLTVTAAMVDGVDAVNNPQSLMVDNFRLFVPEPASIALAGMSLLAIFAVRRTR